MKLIVGLGNPGQSYAGSRHNLGFEVIDKFVAAALISGEVSKKLEAIVYKDSEIILLKPQTFMNLSGRSVKAALDFYKINLDGLLVIHDDVDLELGEIKHQFDRSSAGHNGVTSIINHLGSQAFHRLRLGIGRPEHPGVDTAEWVLQKFSVGEKESVKQLIERAAEVVVNWSKA